MALTKFLVDVNNIQALSDRPNEIDGLDSSQLKEKFDKAGRDIKSYLNNTLSEEIDTSLATMNTSLATMNTSINQISGRISTDYVRTNDSRLSNSRQCNNNFDNWNTARSNLKIGYGTSLPSTADNGSIFFLYE